LKSLGYTPFDIKNLAAGEFLAMFPAGDM